MPSSLNEATAHAACLAQVLREDVLERSARKFLSKLENTSVACLYPMHSELAPIIAGAPVAARQSILQVSFLSSVLVPLTVARVFCASEFEALSVVSKDFCRTMGRAEVLIPLLRLALQGFEESRNLSTFADARLSCMEAMMDAARERLRSLTKADFHALKVATNQQVQPVARPKIVDGQSQIPVLQVMELASFLLQPGEKAHDGFAMQKLARAPFSAKTCAFRCEEMHGVRQKKFAKQLDPQREVLAKAASEKARDGTAIEAVGALSEWLLTIRDIIEERPELCELQLIKEAIIAHVLPLARWAVRPHQRPLLARPAPPPQATTPKSWFPTVSRGAAGSATLTATMHPVSSCRASSPPKLGYTGRVPASPRLTFRRPASPAPPATRAVASAAETTAAAPPPTLRPPPLQVDLPVAAAAIATARRERSRSGSLVSMASSVPVPLPTHCPRTSSPQVSQALPQHALLTQAASQSGLTPPTLAASFKQPSTPPVVNAMERWLDEKAPTSLPEEFWHVGQAIDEDPAASTVAEDLESVAVCVVPSTGVPSLGYGVGKKKGAIESTCSTASTEGDREHGFSYRSPLGVPAVSRGPPSLGTATHAPRVGYHRNGSISSQGDASDTISMCTSGVSERVVGLQHRETS
eukprot:TRINITY_DN38470_c0_g1_i1.p1 TRINITY_DN38470_c0_g1~~TRINITY_DN38470_c0_g1_i1.p1  ORF type:complete len:641 (-),score=113.92 TRINITY_DN38470_c0_g1_i1:207-2129(-)